MSKLILLLISISLFVTSVNALSGLFNDFPQFIIIESTEPGARLYTGLTPVSVANDVNVIALNILADSDWNGLLDGFEGLDLNLTVIVRCIGDVNHVWTSPNNCQDITGFDLGAGAVDETFAVLEPVIPWQDVNVADDITLTNITQITNRAFTNITSRNFSLLSLDDNSSFDDRYLPHSLRSYTGLTPVSVNNDTNVIALNILSDSDWNGTFDGNDSTFFIDWTNSVNRLFSLLTLDDNASFDSRYISGIFEGGSIDVNSNTGHVLVSFDDGNFLDQSNVFTGLFQQFDGRVHMENNPIRFGTNDNVRMLWQTTGNDSFQIGTKLNSVIQSGYISILERADIGDANRSPRGITPDPILRVYSADETNAFDYIEFKHNQTNADINWGTGDLNFVGGNTYTVGDANAQRLCLHDGNCYSEGNLNIESIGITIDGGNISPTIGTKGFLSVPFNARIISVTSLADANGTMIMDIWKVPFSDFPPLDANSITGGRLVRLSNADSNFDNTLTEWDTTINADDVLAFNLDGAISTIQRVTVTLKVIKT